MAAVAPETSRLSGWTSQLAAGVAAAAARALAIEPLRTATVRPAEDGIDLVLPDATVHVRGLVDRGGSQASLSVRFSGPTATARRRAARITRDALPELAEAFDAWRPFADLPDEEFRKLSSSPAGPYGTLRLGYRCNQDCWFCWQDRTAPSPPLDRYRQWLDELAAHGVTALNLTGGEATTWAALPELIERAARTHGMAVSLQTNAIRLARPGYAARLVDAGLRAVMVSLHAADAGISDRMTRAPGTHARTLRGIEEALQVGLHTSLTCVVERENLADLPAHARLIVDRFVAPFPDRPLHRVTYAHPTDYFRAGAWAEHQVPFDQLRTPLTRAVLILRAAGVPVQLGGPCGFPVCALDPDQLPDPYRVLERATFRPEELIHRRFGAACGDCRHRADCFGLRQEYLDAFGEDGLRPVPHPATDPTVAADEPAPSHP